MSIAEVMAGLRAVVSAVVEQRSRLAAVADALSRSRDQFHATTATSGHPLVGEILRRKTTAMEKVREADQLLAGLPVALAEYAATIGATLDVRGAPSVAPGLGRKAGGALPVPTPPAALPPVPPGVVRLAGRLAPWRDGEDAKGYAFDAERRHLDDAPFVSGRIKSAGLGLRAVRGGGLPVTVTDHVEGHVAARMRAKDGPREVTLVINKAPCDDRPFGCHQLLPHIIPQGSRLTVYVVDADGARLHHAYEGTGKAITP